MVDMTRPSWDSFATPAGYVMCSCGQVLQSQEALRNHWQMGHFDYVTGERLKEPKQEVRMETNADKLWDLIYPVLIEKYKRVEGEIDGWKITAYRVVTTVRIDLKPTAVKGAGSE